jgi:fructokinase
MNPAIRIGIDLGGTKIEGIALTSDGRTVARRRVPTPAGDYPGTIAAITGLVAAIEADAKTEAGHIGVCIPGTVSPTTGLVKNANSTWLIGKAFDRDLEAALMRPVRLANDANCFTISEATDGAGAGFDVVFGVILGTGVGGGLARGGQVLTGANAIAGEWGHNPLPWPTDAERPGPDCYCGKAGCIETFLSGPGLVRDYAGTILAPDAATIVRCAAEGEEPALAALERYFDRLARALATVINIADPDMIVLGGGLSNITSLYDEVPRRWKAWIFTDDVATRLCPARHGDSSGVRGAAWLWPSPGD